MRFGLTDATVSPTIWPRLTKGLASAAGADSLWVVDHLVNIVPKSVWLPKYSGAARLVPSPDALFEPWTLLGWLAAKNRMSRLHLGTAVTDGGRRNPAVTAQAAASVHLMSKGRMILGIGTGERQGNQPYGVPWDKPVGRLEEALTVIRALWDSAGEPISRAGTHFPLEHAVFDVPPYKGTRPPIWVAAHGPRMLGITGRLGDGWFPAWPMPPAEYGRRFDVVRAAASDAGRDPSAITGAAWFLTMTASTKGMVDDVLDSVGARLCALSAGDEVWRRYGVTHPLGEGFTGLQDLLPQLIDHESALRYAAMVPDALLRDSFLAGTPAEVLERLAEYRQHGLQYPVMMNAALYFKLRPGLTSTPAIIQIGRTLRRM